MKSSLSKTALVLLSSASCLMVSCDDENTAPRVDDDACAALHCEANQECVNGECRDKEVKDACDDSCGANQECVNGECRDKEVKDACDNACESDEKCESGVCRKLDNNEETQNSDVSAVPGDDEITDDTSASDDTSDLPANPADVKGVVMVTPVEGLVTRLDGTKAFFSVILNSVPAESVTLPVISDNPDIGIPSPEKLTFDKSNWGIPQVVTVTGTDKEIPEDSSYHIVVGPSESEDEKFDKLDAVSVEVMHYNTPVPVDAVIQAEKIALNKSSLDILKTETGVLTATLTPSNVTNPHITWTFENITDDADAVKDDCMKSIAVSYSGKNAETISVKNITVNARTIKVTAKNGEQTASATLNIKPYLPLSMPMSELLKIKNFKAPGMKHPTPKEGETMETAPKLETLDTLGNLACGTYDEYTNKAYFSDIYYKIVRPKMYPVKKEDGTTSYYPTRASVAAAARFLILQFPYDIPYANRINKNMDYFKNAYTDNGSTVVSHYAWSSNTFNEVATAVRAYGLGLTSNVHGSTYANIIKTDAVPWACPRYDKDPSGYRSFSGLECSGFVNWALRNGRLGFGDWLTDVFAKSGKCMKNNEAVRNYKCIDVVNNKKSDGSYMTTASSGNPNNYHDGAYTKMNYLDESDFVPVKDLNENDIKVGDILWYGKYSPTYDASTKKCKPGNGYGHVAMVIGVERGSDNHITKIHYGEAGWSSGNTLTTMTWEEFTQKDKYQNASGGLSTNSWHSLYGKKDANGCETSDARLIKMDKVYNYSQTKGYLPEDAPQGILNKHEYTDFWQ